MRLQARAAAGRSRGPGTAEARRILLRPHAPEPLRGIAPFARAEIRAVIGSHQAVRTDRGLHVHEMNRSASRCALISPRCRSGSAG